MANADLKCNQTHIYLAVKPTLGLRVNFGGWAGSSDRRDITRHNVFTHCTLWVLWESWWVRDYVTKCLVKVCTHFMWFVNNAGELRYTVCSTRPFITYSPHSSVTRSVGDNRWLPIFSCPVEGMVIMFVCVICLWGLNVLLRKLSILLL